MDEYFVFDSGGRFTGEVMSITEEEGRVFDDLREITMILNREKEKS